MQVEIEPALADAVTGELAGVGRQGGQLDAFETGGDVEAGHRVERVDRALDGHRRIAVDLALDVDAGRFRLTAVDGADLAVELLDGGGEVRGQAEVGEVGRAVIDGNAADVNAQRLVLAGRFRALPVLLPVSAGCGISRSSMLVVRSSLIMKRA